MEIQLVYYFKWPVSSEEIILTVGLARALIFRTLRTFELCSGSCVIRFVFSINKEKHILLVSWNSNNYF
jgi:hypothetical protein